MSDDLKEAVEVTVTETAPEITVEGIVPSEPPAEVVTEEVIEKKEEA